MKIATTIVDIIVPALTAYLASSDVCFEYLMEANFLGPSFNIAKAKEICLFINIGYASVLLAIRLAYSKYREQKARKQIASLYNISKQILQGSFEKISRNKDFTFEMRFFVPKKRFLAFLKKEKYFKIKNVHPFANNDVTDNLCFRVSPNPQGLVGQCYACKATIYDENLKTNNKNYFLDEGQIQMTSSLNWSICVPVFGENNTVAAIVAFDSQHSSLPIKKNETAILDIVAKYSQMFYDCDPDLFR